MMRIAAATLALLLPDLAIGQDYAAEIAEIADKSGVRLEFEESDNFVWALGVNKAQVRPAIQAAENGFKIFKEIAGLESWEELWGPAPSGTKKALMVVLGNRLQYQKVLAWYEKAHDPFPGFKEEAGRVPFWPQPTPRVASFIHLKPLTAEGLKNVAVHEVGHLCMLRYKFHNNFIPPWLEEGFGCYLEARVLKRNNCYCFSGGYGDQAARLEKISDIEWVKWKKAIAGMVQKKNDKAMKLILPLRMSQLSGDEIGKAWSVIDFLIQEDPKKFVQFVQLMKRHWPSAITYDYTDDQGKAQEQALKEAYGMDLDALDKRWRDWVRGNYKI